MDLSEIKSSLGELIQETIKLANDNPVPESETKFIRVLEAVFRKNFIRLQAIEKLVENNSTANVAMEITRNMVEDVVGIEYMRLKGEEKYAKKFFNYWTVHYYKLTHRAHQGDEISASEIKEAEKRFNNLPNSIKKRKNWAGCDIDAQLKIILDADVMSSSDAKMAELAYTYGSLKTHFNPYDIMMYLHGDYFSSSSDLSVRMTLVFAVSSQVRFTTRYVDAINSCNKNESYKHYADKANAIIDKYSSKAVADSLLKK